MEGREHDIHPALSKLALCASGDLRGFAAWRLRHHLRRCPLCRKEAEAFRATRDELRRSADREALAALAHWNRREREMIGNIAVGVAAARCIERIGPKRILRSRAAWTCVAVGLLLAGVWAARLKQPRDMSGAAPQQTAGAVVETTPDGIAVRTAGGSLTMLHPASAVVSLGRGPGVAASYIDEETGEVTIANVYGK